MALDVVDTNLTITELKLERMLNELLASGLTEVDLRMMILGHARHGKDDTAMLICAYLNIEYLSSSHVAMDSFLYDLIKTVVPYENKEECYADRVNHRDFWHKAIKVLNHTDKASLSKIIFAKSPMYCGIRENGELTEAAAQSVFNVSIWVDAMDRKPPEPVSSNNIQIQPTYSDASIINVKVDNNTHGHVYLRNSVAAALIEILEININKERR